MIAPFSWRRLTDAGTVFYRLDDSGRIFLQGDASAPPFTTARVRDGRGSFVDSPLASVGLVWSSAGGDSWEVRTSGQPVTMTQVSARWKDLVVSIAGNAGVDPLFVLTTIAAESGNAAPDADGFVKAPRTEPGYPNRSGERDPGDEARDAQDWTASRGQHSSHGLMQTLIGTAVGAAPALFADVEPSKYREVLWRPANSIAAGVAYIAHFDANLRVDPLALRIAYGAGSVRKASPDRPNRWGVVLYDEVVPLRFIALWNDLTAVIGASVSQPSALASRDVARERMWLTLGLSLLALSAAASVGLFYTRKAALA